MSLETQTAFNFVLNEDASFLTIAIKLSRFEAATIEAFQKKLDNSWSASIQEVVIDLDKVDFIDSSGIGALLSVQKKFRNIAKPVMLMNAKPTVISVIELLRLHRVFDIR